MPFLKIDYIRLSYTRLLYYMENRNIVHRRIKEYCTSPKSGILYITENRSIVHHWNQEYCTSLKNRNFVQHRKQEFCTTQKSGILYITHMMRSVNGPFVVARVTTKMFLAVFSAENNCLILEISGLGKNSRFRQQYLVYGNFLILGTKSNI